MTVAVRRCALGTGDWSTDVGRSSDVHRRGVEAVKVFGRINPQ